MAETPGPLECWAIVEDTGDVRRIHGVYLNSIHAITDSGALQPAHFVEVVPFPIHRAPQWSSHREPALEQTDEDFDIRLELDIPGL
jgi:hypothetical protein